MTNTTTVFDTTTAFPYTNILSFAGSGVYYWTALAYDSAFNEYWAIQTNMLTIVTELEQGVHLLTPINARVLTNVFACNLIADYGLAILEKQLSTNAGTMWFNYDAENPVVFRGVATYHWTARGRSAAGWWPAPETNTLVVTTNYTGERAIFLLEPADGSLARELSPLFRVQSYGPVFSLTGIMIDDQQYVVAEFPTNIYLSPGAHNWSARGGVLPGPVYTYAPATNMFTVLPEGVSAAIAALMLTALVARKRSRLPTGSSAIYKE